jgi:hypothetical protein
MFEQNSVPLIKHQLGEPDIGSKKRANILQFLKRVENIFDSHKAVVREATQEVPVAIRPVQVDASPGGHGLLDKVRGNAMFLKCRPENRA